MWFQINEQRAAALISVQSYSFASAPWFLLASIMFHHSSCSGRWACIPRPALQGGENSVDVSVVARRALCCGMQASHQPSPGGASARLSVVWVLRSEIYWNKISEHENMLERAGVTLVGEHVKHIAVGRVASAEISAVGFQREDIDINILSPSKVPVLYRWVTRAVLTVSQPAPTQHHHHHHPLLGWWEVSQAVSRNCTWQVCNHCPTCSQNFQPKMFPSLKCMLGVCLSKTHTVVRTCGYLCVFRPTYPHSNLLRYAALTRTEPLRSPHIAQHCLIKLNCRTHKAM